MPRFLLVAYFLFLLVVDSICQVYHFETGKVLPINEPDKIIWKQGIYNKYLAEYGTLVVKENRNERSSRLINIPIIRIKAAQIDTSLNPIFLLNGGPGESNFQSQLFFDDLVQHRDLVLVGYRGVDGSVKLDCPCMKNALLSETLSLENYTQLFEQAVDSCFTLWSMQKIDIRGYSMDEVVQDIEITRTLLGYDKIDFLAFSYGTMLSQLYYSNYAAHVQKMVLIGARSINTWLFDGESYNMQIIRYYNTFNGIDESLDKDSVKSLLYDVETLLFKILEDNIGLNPYRFLFFGFSKLYSMHEIEKFFEAYESATNNEFERLDKLYSEFYKNFPGAIVLGDVILKKQGRVDFNINQTDTTLGYKITNAVNAWYSPQIKLLSKNSKTATPKVNQNDSVEVLYISGEYDVASPPEYLYDTAYFNYTNNQKLVIPKVGHLDLFDSKSNQIKEAVLVFFK